MSRFLTRNLLALSLFTTLSTSFAPLASADRAAPHFAQPPPSHVVSAGAPAETHMEEQMPPADPAAVRMALLAARAKNLDAFRVYQRKGVFPSNTFQGTALNVWRDREGHFCAAATIIKMSGQDALVDSVADQNNFIKLGEVTQGPVMDWILTSGFTQQEIAAIQEPFMPVQRPTPEPTVEPRLRAAETKRLMKKYQEVEQAIVKAQNTSLDLAVDRLMKRPDLAWRIVARLPAMTPAS